MNAAMSPGPSPYYYRMKAANKLLTLWNEHRITDEEFESMERMIRANDLETIELAGATAKALFKTRPKYQMRRVTKSRVKKMRERMYHNLIKGNSLLTWEKE